MPHLQRRTFDGVQLYYEQLGSTAGPRLFVLSPSNTSTKELRPYLESYTQLASKFNIVVFDHRGTGGSSMPPDGWGATDGWAAPSMKLLAADALALLDALGWESAHVLGLSFGGMVAQEVAISRPSAIQTLTLVCTSAGVGEGVALSYPLHTLLDSSSEERSATMLRLADLRRDSGWVYDSQEGQAVMQFMGGMEAALERTPGALEGRRWQLTARSQHDTGERLPGALLPEAGAARTIPTAVFAAVHDGLTPPQAALALSEILGAADVHGGPIWFEAGHWPNLVREQPKMFAAALEEFTRDGRVSSALWSSSEELKGSIDWGRRFQRDNCLDGGCAIL